MDGLDEYLKRGGSFGIATTQLQQELLDAQHNTSHILRPVIDAPSTEAAGRLLLDILLSESENSSSSLQCAGLFLVKMPLIAELTKYATELTLNGDDSELDKLPRQIIQWAAMNVADKARQVNAAKNRQPRAFQQLIISLVSQDPNMDENTLEHALRKQEDVTFTPDDMIFYKEKSMPRTALKDRLYRAKKKIKSR